MQSNLQGVKEMQKNMFFSVGFVFTLKNMEHKILNENYLYFPIKPTTYIASMADRQVNHKLTTGKVSVIFG